MTLSLNDIKIGINIIYQDEPYRVMRASFLRMQQRKPVMQTKLRNLITGKVLEVNFKPGDKVEGAELERTKASYLYKDNKTVYFMDNSSYEQFSFSLDFLGEKANYLKEGLQVDILEFKKKPISTDLPPKIDYKVTSAAPGVRGNTAQGNVTKPVTLETGLVIQAPLFVKEGDTVRVNTETGQYVERV